MLHKPTGYTCSTSDPGQIVYELLPPRFRHRDPIVATVGRLDRDTTGLLLMTDDGKLLHKIVTPRSKLPKIYEATLARDLRGDEVKIFASGKLMLESEREPLAPATLEVLGPRQELGDLPIGRWRPLDTADRERLFTVPEL
jgi:16S rRNA pseudouridine516 synthase